MAGRPAKGRMPTRKSIAGPGLLVGQTGPTGAKNYDLAALGKNKTNEENCPVGFVAKKDYQTIEGRIKVDDITDVGSELLCCQYNEQHNYISVGTTDGNLMLYNSGTGEFVMSLSDEEIKNENAPITSIKHRPFSKNYPVTNCLTCTYGNGFVKCWNYNFKQTIYTIKENRQTFGITYHPKFPKFVTVGDNMKICLYDEESKTQERILTKSNDPSKHDGPTSRVFSACFNPRSNYELITGGWDDIIHFWDLRQPYATRKISGAHIAGEGLDINSKGTEVLVCAFQNKDAFRVFDYGSGKILGKIDIGENVGKLYTGRFANKDYAVCGGTSPNTFQVVDLSTYLVVAKVSGMPSALYGLDMGAPKKEESSHARSDNFASLPPIAFVCGKKLYQIDFY